MAGGTRGGNGRFIRNIKTAQRDADAAALRAKGLSFQRIANELGFSSKAKAYEAVQRALADLPREGIEDLRRMELERLDGMYQAAMDVLEREHVAISQGKVVRRRVGTEVDEFGHERLDDEGKPIPLYADVLDDGPVLQAIDRLLKVQERRAKLLGLDAPTKVEMLTVDAIDAEIKKLQAEFAENADAP